MCDFRHCISGQRGTIEVTENVGDGAWRTLICRPCANAVGLKEGDDIPHDAEAVNKCLLAAQRGEAKPGGWVAFAAR